MTLVKKLLQKLFREELDIHQRLLNLILSAAFVGGIVSLTATILLHDYLTALVTAVLLLVVFLALYLSVFHNQTQIATILCPSGL